MEESKDLYHNWVLVAVGPRYWLGEEVKDGSVDTSEFGRIPYNYSYLKNAFELLILRAQQPSPDKTTTLLMQNNAWTTNPMCTGGVDKEVMWTERTYLNTLISVDRASYVSFIETAQRDFDNNRAAASGISMASAEDLERLGKRRA
jgi:hypothetical protein